MRIRSIRFRRRHSRIPEFTGNCMVRQTTQDGYSVGPCWHSTYDGVCHIHGDVSTYLQIGSEHMVDIWPADYQLEKNDGVAWAERLRARQQNNKRGNGS